MRLLIAFFALLFVTGCSTVNIQDYQNKSPTLKVEDYFQGETKAWGIFQDRFGQVRRRFTVDIVGTWDEENAQLKLIEDFIYDDGQTEQRIWVITKTGDNKYEGYADGVVGIATGESEGNAFNFRYKFDLPMNGKTLRVSFDDWMYLQDNNILFNKATIKKLGITLGDVYIFFDKRT